MAATPEDHAAPEPFSPSVFLDLPPTPHPVGDVEDPASSTDDLVLPFIRRMLMGEDTNENFFYQYPDDHLALIQAQQPFAQILSGAAATFSSHGDATNSSVSGSATTDATGSGAFNLSLASTDAPALANATWPYDPLELSQVLLSRMHPDTGVRVDGFSGGGDANALLSPGRQDAYHQSAGEASAFFFLDGGEEGTETHTTTNAPAGGDGVTMDMLNLAFLKGMEEASKFLPTATRDGDQPRVFASNSLKTKGVVDGMSLFFQESGNCRGRGCKDRHNWDDLEAEAGRRSKVMVPEPEETGEMVDAVFLKGFQLAMEKMHGLSISTGSMPGEKGRQNTNEAVDLRTLLTHCAEAVSRGNRPSATELLQQIKQRSSPRGDASQRLAHCFAEGLEVRLAGTGGQVYKSLMAKRVSSVECLKAYQLYLKVCPFKMIAFKFSHMAICRAIVGRKKVHIVDYGEHYGFLWPPLLNFWATREGGPPEVRITGIDLPRPGFRPAARIEETGRRLSNFASQRGVPFKFHSIVASKWEMICADDLNIEPDEVLIVNGLFHFGKLMDEDIDIESPSPRDMVLANIQKMRPDVFILCVENSSYNTPFFVTRFREALFYYSAMFDMMDATTTPRDNDERLLVEKDILGSCALNAIACEGLDRVERPETYKQWHVRCNRAGLKQLPLNPYSVKYLSTKVMDGYHKDFAVDVDQQWLLEGWKGRILYAMSTWVADDPIS